MYDDPGVTATVESPSDWDGGPTFSNDESIVYYGADGEQYVTSVDNS